MTIVGRKDPRQKRRAICGSFESATVRLGAQSSEVASQAKDDSTSWAHSR